MGKIFLIQLLTHAFFFSLHSQALYDQLKTQITYVVAKDGTGDFMSLQSAIDATVSNSSDKQLIYVKSGVYKEKIEIDSDKPNLIIVGEDVDNTILSWGDYSGSGVLYYGIQTSKNGVAIGTSTSHTMYVVPDDFTMMNITVQNTAGDVGQAVALNSKGDRHFYFHCRLLGRQDTYYTWGGGRYYLNDCYIEGTVDYIFGRGAVLFEQCQLHSLRSGGYLTAAATDEGFDYGYVFNNCKLTVAPGVTNAYLGRPWKPFCQTVFKNCDIDAGYHAQGWSEWAGNTNHQTCYYAEYNNCGAGASPSTRVSWSKQLSDAEAATYTMQELFGRDVNPRPYSSGWLPDLTSSVYNAVKNSTARFVSSACYKTEEKPLLAFPTADGYGKYTTGGRGGKVYYVTNLNDSGEGSLRNAVSSSETEPLTVLFNVSGTIKLESTLKINHSNLTIAGQSAPGDGICVKGFSTDLKADNLIIRYIRFRPGDEYSLENSGINFENDGMFGRYRKNIIIDHCSFSWGIDETASFYNNENFTLQYCIIAESLYASFHEKGNHGYGGIWGGMGASFHHNLLADHTSRNPRFCGARYHMDSYETEIVEFSNNVIFNWGFNSAYGGEAGKHNMVNNYYKPGPATSSSVRYRLVNPSYSSDYNQISKWYVSGNFIEGYSDIHAYNGGFQPQSSDSVAGLWARVASPIGALITGIQPASVAYENVLNNAGANLVRDAVDKRIVSQVRTGAVATGSTYGEGTGIIDSQTDVGGYPQLVSAAAPLDSDSDGMPDWWEQSHGLNDLMPDGNADDDGDGYTNLEEYLNCLSGENDGCVTRKPARYIFAYDDSGDRSWFNVNNWTPSAMPIVGDTAVVRSGELQLVDQMLDLPVYVEPSGAVKIVSESSVAELVLQGGTLSVYTGGAGAAFSTKLMVENNARINVGATALAVLTLKGELEGDAHLRKTGAGELALFSDLAEFSGNWSLEEGLVSLNNSSGLGTGAVLVSNGAMLSVQTSDVFIRELTIETGTVELLQDLNVQDAVFDGKILEPGIYTAIDLPRFISGTGSLTVTGLLDCYGVNHGTAYLDLCGTCVGGTTGQVGCASQKQQAEDVCDWDGVVEDIHMGFEGDAYINVDNAVGKSAAIRVYAYKESTETLYVRFANGAGTDRPCSVRINDKILETVLEFPVTGAWSAWEDASVLFTLQKGINEIKISGLTDDGPPNLDHFVMTGDISFLECASTQTLLLKEGWNLVSLYVQPINYGVSAVFPNALRVMNFDSFYDRTIPDQFCSLTGISAATAYWVYNGKEELVEVDGYITDAGMPQLQTGWNMFGSPWAESVKLEDAFGNELQEIKLIKTLDASWQKGGAASLQSIEAGKAYYIFK